MFIPLIRKRRSIRRFLNKEVEAEKIDQLVEAALRSPSSRGLNPWQFIIVTERDLLKKLSKAKKHGSSFLNNAPLGVAVCADPEKSDVWIEDASITATYIQLAAESLGLGSCWVQIRDRIHDKSNTAEEYVSGLLNIPGNLRIESVIAIGYPDEEKPPHSREELQYEKVHLNLYGRLYGK
ncbi:MAG TPA: NAD(P)H-dependent dehydrogenase/reductase [Nitrospirae bacterium]|nr:NAD(P)H-dependent dehydrogenase/reductase [Nitrospirota bacterium]